MGGGYEKGGGGGVDPPLRDCLCVWVLVWILRGRLGLDVGGHRIDTRKIYGAWLAPSVALQF